MNKEKHLENEVLELKNTIADLTKLYLESLRDADNAHYYTNKAFDDLTKLQRDHEIYKLALDLIAKEFNFEDDVNTYINSARLILDENQEERNEKIVEMYKHE